MEELKKENELLLKLVKTLQSQITSKTKQNQLLFQQYEQLAQENKAQEAEALALKSQNRSLRRGSLTNKEAPRYTYAVLNSPRTEKLMAELEQTQLQLTSANQQNQRLNLEIEQLKSQVIHLNSLPKTPKKEDSTMVKYSERIEQLERSLSKKEKEMRELTLIMYAKDATTSQINLKQEQKNKEIDQLRFQITILKQQQDKKLAEMKEREKKALYEAQKKENQIKQLRNQLKEESKKVEALQQKIKEKQNRITQLESSLISKLQQIEQLSQTVNDQTIQIQTTIQKLNTSKQAEEIFNAKQLLGEILASIKQKKELNLALEEKINLSREALKSSELSNDLMMQLKKQNQNQINSYQQIRNNLMGQIDHYNKHIALLKQQFINYQQQIEKSHATLELNHHQINSFIAQHTLLEQQTINNHHQLLELQDKIHKNQNQVNHFVKQEPSINMKEQKTISDYKIELSEKEQSLAAFMDVLDNLHSELKTSSTKIDHLNSQNEQLLSKYRQVAQQLDKSTTSENSLKIENKSLQQEIEHLKIDNERIQNSLKSIVGQNQNLKAEVQYFKNKIPHASKETPQNNSVRMISNIKSVRSNHHNLQFHSEEETSRIQTENQSLHETIQEQNYTIMELQENLMRSQHTHNTEVIALRRNIAELNAELLKLRRKLYEINPQSLDITAFLKENPKKDASIMLPLPLSRPTSPPTSTSARSDLPTRHAPRRSELLPKQTLPQSSIRSNPYIAMMTNEKGELRFPQSGNWSIQELRNLLQQ